MFDNVKISGSTFSRMFHPFRAEGYLRTPNLGLRSHGARFSPGDKMSGFQPFQTQPDWFNL